MKYEITTEIEINAAIEKIWEILMDFENYSEWNPFIKTISGEKGLGKVLNASLKQPSGRGMNISPEITKLEKNREFAWLGKLFFEGLFDGNHIFLIEEIDKNRSKFIHKEKFSGILVRMMKKMLDTDTKNGFIAMNEALKKRVEGIN